MKMPAQLASSAFDQATAWVNEHHAAQIDFLREVVRVPTDTPPGNNAPAAQRTAELLTALGFAVEKIAVPQGVLTNLGMQSVTNLIVRHRFCAEGPTIALNAHGDVVPPGDGWTHDPYGGEIVDGRMFARGVAVSKSDIATYAYALLCLKALHASGAALIGAVELHFTYDEEFGGLAGPAYLLEGGYTKPDFVIAAGFSYNIITAHNGCLQFEVTVLGESAHGAMPETGVDALRATNAIITAIYDDVERLRTVRSSTEGITHPNMIVGQIEGGTNTNVIPGKVSFRMDRRMIPEEDPAAVEVQVRALIESTAARFPGIRIQIRRLLLAHALKAVAGQEKLVRALQGPAQAIFGEPIRTTGVPLYTDARLYAAHGIPIVLYGAGPRGVQEANAKRADENLLLEDLRRATIVVATALTNVLSPGEST